MSLRPLFIGFGKCPAGLVLMSENSGSIHRALCEYSLLYPDALINPVATGTIKTVNIIRADLS